MENKTSSWTLTTLMVVAKAEALTGPMTPPGKRVQTVNAPGSDELLLTHRLWHTSAIVILITLLT